MSGSVDQEQSAAVRTNRRLAELLHECRKDEDKLKRIIELRRLHRRVRAIQVHQRTD